MKATKEIKIFGVILSVNTVATLAKVVEAWVTAYLSIN